MRKKIFRILAIFLFPIFLISTLIIPNVYTLDRGDCDPAIECCALPITQCYTDGETKSCTITGSGCSGTKTCRPSGDYCLLWGSCVADQGCGSLACTGTGSCPCPDGTTQGTCTGGTCTGCPEVEITSLDAWLAANPCLANQLCVEVALLPEGEFKKIVDQDRKTISIPSPTSVITTKVEVPNQLQPDDYCKEEGLYSIIVRRGAHDWEHNKGTSAAATLKKCDAINVDWDTIEFCSTTCTGKPVMWVPEAPKGGQCCGDDDQWVFFDKATGEYLGHNPGDYAEEDLIILLPDDPDWSESACKACITKAAQGAHGLSPDQRVWDPGAGCCGDDPDDFVDVSEIFCTQCLIGRHKDNPSLRVWDPLAGPGGACCGNGENGFDNENGKRHKGDDPDMGPTACTRCDFGDNADNPSIRIWDPAVNQCCGDDVSGSSLPLEEQLQTPENKWETLLDDPDWSELSCNNCRVAGFLDQPWSRVWESSVSQCCGDDFGNQTTTDSEGNVILIPPDDPDWGQDSCLNCPIGLNQNSRDYSSDIGQNGCCGDDPEDCAFTTGQWLCNLDKDNSSPEWEFTDELQAGDIIEVGCVNKQYLGTGQSWKICGSFWIENVGHQYLCSDGSISDNGTTCSSNLCSCCSSEILCKSFDECSWDNTTSRCRPNTCEQLENEVIGKGDYYCSATEGCDVTHKNKLGPTDDCDMCCVSGSIAPNYCNDPSKNKFEIYECIGKDVGYSSGIAGHKKSIGEKVTYGDKTYYCSSNATWEFELDGDEDACEAAGFTFTGNYCCGDTKGEYYRDIISGCWDSKTVLNNTLVTKDIIPPLPEVLFLDGYFKGCKPSDNILSIVDAHANDQLVSDEIDCTINGTWFCSYLGVWNKTLGLNRTHLSELPWQNNSAQFAECCQPTECWRGNQCIRDQAPTPKSLPYYANYRCVNGIWKNSTLKFDWNDDNSGYCPSDDMCLVNNDGNNVAYQNNADPSKFNYNLPNDPSYSTNPQCINRSQFILDHFCLDGNWSLRTKLLALKLLDYAESQSLQSYTLQCDDYSKTSAKSDYRFLGKSMVDLISTKNCFNHLVPCANNFCILKYNDGKSVILASSLNYQINTSDEDREFSFLYVFGKREDELNYCDSAALYNDEDYHECIDNDVWYNPKHQLIIYSKEPINLPTGTFVDIIRETFSGIIYYLKNFWNPKYVGMPTKINIDFLNQSEEFNKLYISQKTNKTIQAIIETIKRNQYLTITYSGFDSDVCKTVALYNIREPGFSVFPPSSRKGTNEIVCKKDEFTNIYYVFSKKPSGTSWIAYDAWNDLTIKSRVK